MFCAFQQARVPLAQSVSGESFSLSEYYDAEEDLNNVSDYSSEVSSHLYFACGRLDRCYSLRF